MERAGVSLNFLFLILVMLHGILHKKFIHIGFMLSSIIFCTVWFM